MPEDQLQITGGVTKALVDALDQIHTAVTASLANPDGSPSGTAVYMHMPVGRPIDPKMYANAWTPAGGSAYGAVGNDGQFAAPPAPTQPATAASPAAQVAAVPSPDPKLQLSLSSAFNTARLVDEMLLVTDKGIAASWPDRTVSTEYFTVLAGMQAEPVPEPSADIKARIAAAEKTLYLLDAEGNYTGYSPLYTSYRHNQKALADARSAYALAYAAAMADPVAGQAWPVTSSSYQNTVDQAYNDLKDMGGQRVEDAVATLQAVGGSAAAALIAKARKLYDDYSVALSGSIATKTPWSYIDPTSWWDHKNVDFGIQRVKASSSMSFSAGQGASNSYGHSFYRDTSSSDSASVSADFWLVEASANASHSETQHDDGNNHSSSSSSGHQDSSSTATIEFEWFIASVERPWFLGDLFHIQGWYLAGAKKNVISDGTITGQIDKPDRILPMVPKGFLVVRNVKITADSWGDMESQFQAASDSASGHTDSSTTSYGGSIGYFCVDGSYQHSDSQDSGAFSNQAAASNGFTYTKHDQGGTLELIGSQVLGWVGQIQPSSPYRDDPNLKQDDAAPAANGTPAAPAVTPDEPVPAAQTSPG
jgi:hypothetical protein